jgi:hypothetical protein
VDGLKNREDARGQAPAPQPGGYWVRSTAVIVREWHGRAIQADSQRQRQRILSIPSPAGKPPAPPASPPPRSSSQPQPKGQEGEWRTSKLSPAREDAIEKKGNSTDHLNKRKKGNSTDHLEKMPSKKKETPLII